MNQAKDSAYRCAKCGYGLGETADVCEGGCDFTDYAQFTPTELAAVNKMREWQAANRGLMDRAFAGDPAAIAECERAGYWVACVSGSDWDEVIDRVQRVLGDQNQRSGRSRSGKPH